MKSSRNGVHAQANSDPNISVGFKYHGGPVISNPAVAIIGVGTGSEIAYLSMAATGLLQSDYMNTLAQYGVGKGKVTSIRSVTSQKSDLSVSAVKEIINSNRDSDANCYLLILGKGIGITDGTTHCCERSGDNAFGFHDFYWRGFSRTYYAVVPSLDDTCLKAACSADDGCSLHLAQHIMDRQTQIMSHELAEMFTDPGLDAWYGYGGEVGDICNGISRPLSVTVNGSTVTINVQPEYSKYADEHGEVTHCVAGGSKPVPATGNSAGFFAWWATFWEEVWNFFKDNLGLQAGVHTMRVRGE